MHTLHSEKAVLMHSGKNKLAEFVVVSILPYMCINKDYNKWWLLHLSVRLNFSDHMFCFFIKKSLEILEY